MPELSRVSDVEREKLLEGKWQNYNDKVVYDFLHFYVCDMKLKI